MSLKTVVTGKWKELLVTWMSVREYSERLMSSVEKGSCSSHVITRSDMECCPAGVTAAGGGADGCEEGVGGKAASLINNTASTRKTKKVERQQNKPRSLKVVELMHIRKTLI